MQKFYVFIFLTIVCFPNCTPDDVADDPDFEVEGLRPIYAEADWKIIQTTVSRPIQRLGKIYYKDQTIYVNESNFGIHIINNSDPSNPVQTHFLEIAGCRDIAIKGNYLYADNVTDLVTLDISDINNPVEVHRIEGIHPVVNQQFPESYEGYFECVEENMGEVVGWESAILENPKCWR